MTDEEIAKKYAIGRTYPKFETNYIANFVLREVEGAFLAGLKAGRPEWHKVSDVDLPTEEKQYILKFKDGTIDILYVGIDGNLEPFIVTREGFEFYKDVEKWCEIPKE